MKNKILSILCVIAMFATMMNMFVVNAADAPAITLTVVSQATDTKPAEISVSYSGVPEGKQISSIQIVLPLDTTKFTFGDNVDPETDYEYVYDSNAKAVKMAFLATKAKEYIKETSGEIGSFTLALAKDAAAGQTYTFTADAENTFFSYVTDSGVPEKAVATVNSVSLSTGEKAAPAIPAEPEVPTDAFVYAKADAQPAKGGDIVTFNVTYGNTAEGRDISSIQLVIPVDSDKFTFGDNVDPETDYEYVYDSNAKAIKMAFLATKAKEYIKETSGELGSFTIKLAEGLAEGDEVQLTFDAENSFLSYTTDSGVPEKKVLSGIASKLVVGAKDSGSEPAETTLTVEPTAKTAKAGENVVFTVTTNADEYTATVDNSNVTKKATETYTYTVPATAAKDDVIEITFKAGDKTVTAKITVTDDTTPAETTLTVEPTAKTAKAGEDVVFTVTTNADEYTATADKGEVAKDGNKVTVTVPATAVKDDVITVTFKAGDKEVTAKITVEATEKPVANLTPASVSVKDATGAAQTGYSFSVDKTADKAKVDANIDDTKTYIILFDFNAAGFLATPITGAQIKALYDDDTTNDWLPTVYASNKQQPSVSIVNSDFSKVSLAD